MQKKDWLQTHILLKSKIAHLKKHPQKNEKIILNFYILILLIENFLHQPKLINIKNDESITFIDFANYTKTMNLSTFFSDAPFDEELKEKVITPLSECLVMIEKIRSQHHSRHHIPKSKSEPWFFSPNKTLYLLNAKAIVTILTKSDAGELESVFAHTENIYKMMKTSDDLLPALRNLLPAQDQIMIYRLLYDASSFSPHFTRLQNFIAHLHAIEFSRSNPNNFRCRYFYRFLMMVDKILENRKTISITTRKKIAAHIIHTLIMEYAQKSGTFYTLPSLLAMKFEIITRTRNERDRHDHNVLQNSRKNSRMRI
jgi:hypothetical protein